MCLSKMKHYYITMSIHNTVLKIITGARAVSVHMGMGSCQNQMYYSSIKFWFLQIDGLWLTFYYLLHPDYHEYWQPLTWNTKVKTSGGFANIAQLLHVPGLPVHALGGEKVHRAFALQKWLDRLRVKPENTEMLISLSSSWTNTWPTNWSFWIFCYGAYPLVTFWIP